MLPVLAFLLPLSTGALASDGLIPDPDAEAGPLPDALVADHAYARVFMGIRDGVPATGYRGGTPHTGAFELVLIQPPEGYMDSAYRCTLKWTDLAATATPLDVRDHPEMWAAWRLGAGTQEPLSESCALLDPQRWGEDPAATVAAAGWSIGLGPRTPSMSATCPVPSSVEYVTVYAWMNGAEPMPAGLAQALALDEDGHTTGQDVAGASSADALPDDLFVHHACAASFGI